MLSGQANLGDKFIKKFKEEFIIKVRKMITFSKRGFITGSGQMEGIQGKFYSLTSVVITRVFIL